MPLPKENPLRTAASAVLLKKLARVREREENEETSFDLLPSSRGMEVEGIGEETFARCWPSDKCFESQHSANNRQPKIHRLKRCGRDAKGLRQSKTCELGSHNVGRRQLLVAVGDW